MAKKTPEERITIDALIAINAKRARRATVLNQAAIALENGADLNRVLAAVESAGWRRGFREGVAEVHGG